MVARNMKALYSEPAQKFSNRKNSENCKTSVRDEKNF